MGELLAGLALVLFSCNIIMTKVASGRVAISTGFVISVAVNLGFSFLVFCVELALRTSPLVWNWGGFGAFLLAGVFSTYLGRFFFFESVVRFGPARASVFQITAPLFTVLIAWLFLGERLRLVDYIGIVLTVIGLFFVVYVPGSLTARAAAPVQQARGNKWTGWIFRSVLVLGLGASLCYATSSVLRGGAMKLLDEPILGAVLGSASGLGLHLLTNGEGRTLLPTLLAADRKGVWLFVITGVLTITAQTLVFVSFRYIEVSIAMLIASCVPVLVIPMSYLLLGNQERIGPRTIAGTLLTMAGIALVLLR
ncbi:MAG: DMT family transporter [Pseudomonadota bacterium]